MKRQSYLLLNSSAELGRFGSVFKRYEGLTCDKRVQDWKVVSPRVSCRRILSKPLNITLTNAYAPTNEADADDKDNFYSLLQEVMSRVPAGDINVPLGDFNAKVGQATADVCGTHSLHTESDNGARLADFASSDGDPLHDVCPPQAPQAHVHVEGSGPSD